MFKISDGRDYLYQWDSGILRLREVVYANA